MMFVWQKLTDARGVKRRPCWMRSAMRSSGYSREFLVRPDETGRFWGVFLLVTVVYTIGLAIWDQLIKPLFGLSTAIQLGSIVDLIRYVPLGAIVGIALGIMNKIYGWRSAGHAVAALTRAGLCASCGYSLYECEPEPDGCTVCPECGGAWRLPE